MDGGTSHLVFPDVQAQNVLFAMALARPFPEGFWKDPFLPHARRVSLGFNLSFSTLSKPPLRHPRRLVVNKPA